MLAVAEHFHAVRRRGILVHLAKNGFQRFDHRLLAVEVQGTHFVPRVAVQQVHAAHQAVLLLAKAKDVQLAEVKMDHLIAEGRRRVVFQVDDDRQMANLARAVERFWRRRRQTQREVVRHIRDHLLQLSEIDHLVAFDKQARARGQQAVKPGPGHQLVQIAVIFQRLMADDGIHAWRTVVQIPPGAVRAARRHVDKGQIRF